MNKLAIEGGILNSLHQAGLAYWFKKKTNEKKQITIMEKIIDALSNESLRITTKRDGKDKNSVALYVVISTEAEPELSFIFECETDDKELKKIKNDYNLLLSV